LKIDTQGYDLEVLKGAENTLQSIRALQLEASVRPIYEGMPGFREVLDYLMSRGFALSAMSLCWFPIACASMWAMRRVQKSWKTALFCITSRKPSAASPGPTRSACERRDETPAAETKPLHPRAEPDHGAPVAYPYPDGCGSWQQADVRTARDRLGWRPRINLEESLADIWMEAACRI
jgi:hypothetical protein